MILDVYNAKDKTYLNKLKKTKGIELIETYLPHLNPIKQFYVINNLSEWYEIKDKFPETVTCRIDTKVGTEVIVIHGTTREKERIPDYIIDVSKKVQDPYFMCLELEKGSNERIYTNGGFFVDLKVGEQIIIGYVGPGYDCGSLTKGEAEHETWVIPWDKNAIKREDAIDQYRVKRISQEAYTDSTINRIKFLISEYPKREQEIIENFSRTYEGIDIKLFKKLQEEVLIPMWEQQEKLVENGMQHCGIEINVVADNRLVPFEIETPEIFKPYQKERKLERKQQEVKNWLIKEKKPNPMIYGKAKGIILLNKYLPQLYPYKKITIISSIDEWNQIKDKVPDRIMSRTDTKIGDTKNVRISGTSGKKEDIPKELEEIKRQNPDGVLLLLNMKTPVIPRYEEDGGFNVAFNINENVIIELVGKGFDGRELTREKAVHERYVIPWNEVLFIRDKYDMLKSKTISKYIVDDKEYKRTREDRIEFLKEMEGDTEAIYSNVPEQYKAIDEEIIRSILNDVIFELCKRKSELLRDGLRTCNIQGNIVDGKVVPIEIFRPERLIAKQEIKREDEADR